MPAIVLKVKWKYLLDLLIVKPGVFYLSWRSTRETPSGIKYVFLLARVPLGETYVLNIPRERSTRHTFIIFSDATVSDQAAAPTESAHLNINFHIGNINKQNAFSYTGAKAFPGPVGRF